MLNLNTSSSTSSTMQQSNTQFIDTMADPLPIATTDTQYLYDHHVMNNINTLSTDTDTDESSVEEVCIHDIKSTSSESSNNENLLKITMSDSYQTDIFQIIDDTSDDNDDEISMKEFLLSMSKMNEELLFSKHGYQKLSKISNTIQGEIYKAKILPTTSTMRNKFTTKDKYVAIKKTDKYLLKQKIARNDDNDQLKGFNFCIEENIIKEALILKHLTVDNAPIGDYIVKYIDFFQSDTDYYLVIEYIESEMNLKQFIDKSFEYINNGKLSMRLYQRMIKYLLWQLFVTVSWLHETMNCCHLDLCLENVMVKGAEFIEDPQGNITISSKISAKLCDFGVAEIFESNRNFKCDKQGLSLENELYQSPKQYNGDIYDARFADNWSLGIILFESLTGRKLYDVSDLINNKNGFYALNNGKLKSYLRQIGELTKFNPNSYHLLFSLLIIDDQERISGINILKNAWFTPYFSRYKSQISKKFNHQRKQLIQQKEELGQYETKNIQ